MIKSFTCFILINKLFRKKLKLKHSFTAISRHYFTNANKSISFTVFYNTPLIRTHFIEN